AAHVVAGFPGRCRGRNRQHRQSGVGAHRGSDRAGGGDMTVLFRKEMKVAMPFDAEAVRGQFPILSRTVYGKPLVYLDSGASAQKPSIVLDTMLDFTQTEYANVHRGVHFLSAAATDRY